jgi:serine protein kinase
MENQTSILDRLGGEFDSQQFRLMHEEISFEEYLSKCYKNPRLVRTSYQRLYDMIMAAGTSKFKRYRKTYTHYNFFDDPEFPIFGLEDTLNDLVKFIRGAAGGYGTERRVLLLHGPVGSAKSTICRRLKRGMEKYSRTESGAWYTYKWINLPTGEKGIYTHVEDTCPMHEEPLKLIPQPLRDKMVKELNEALQENYSESEKINIYTLKVEGELCPRCKKFLEELMVQNGGDWKKVIQNHIRVVRKVFSEPDRVGIATFQPKDEKNQDSTELTGDINYAKLPHFGSDSDPRAFNFDGEFCVGNRGVVEFIEMLKLAQEFLYDLLGASQERQIKPKKFAQISVDTVLIGHSVHGDTPIPHVYDGILDVAPIAELADREVGKLQVFSVDMSTGAVELTHVKNVFSHPFEGDWVVNEQNGEKITTTPNHSVYKKLENGALETFYPGEDATSEIATVKLPLDVVLNYPQTERWKKFFQNV